MQDNIYNCDFCVKKIQIFISLLICSQKKRKIQFKLYLINIPKAIHIHTEGYSQETST